MPTLGGVVCLVRKVERISVMCNRPVRFGEIFGKVFDLAEKHKKRGSPDKEQHVVQLMRVLYESYHHESPLSRTDFMVHYTSLPQPFTGFPKLGLKELLRKALSMEWFYAAANLIAFGASPDCAFQGRAYACVQSICEI